jgi:glutamate synthase (NADPH/NADH) small chain
VTLNNNYRNNCYDSGEYPMLHFVTQQQQYPDIRISEQRAKDFKEIYTEYLQSKAQSQASRCSQCGVPFCQIHCPLSNNIPDWLKLASEGNLQEAYLISSQTNLMPEICGRICPQDRLCEGNCVIEQSGHGAVTIGAIEKFLTETAWEQGWVDDIMPIHYQSQSVGIIGSGPAGLAAAEILRINGYNVTIYDRYDRAGGLLTYGIPDFKLEKSVIMRRIERLKRADIQFIYGCDIGNTLPFAELQERHDAILIATGVYKARSLNLTGLEQKYYIPALDFLIASNKVNFGDTIPEIQNPDGRLNVTDKNIVVIGGGDTAMDCVRTAIRRGAASVTCLYRRDKDNMPGSKREVKNALEEGVKFEFLSSPKAVTTDSDGKPKSLIVTKMSLGAKDATGRHTSQEIAGSQFTINADMIIGALGFEPENLPILFDCPDLTITKWGTVQVNHQTAQTAVSGVFAAGDIVRGASLVVWAIKDGRDCAKHIMDYLKQQNMNNSQKVA